MNIVDYFDIPLGTPVPTESIRAWSTRTVRSIVVADREPAEYATVFHGTVEGRRPDGFRVFYAMAFREMEPPAHEMSVLIWKTPRSFYPTSPEDALAGIPEDIFGPDPIKTAIVKLATDAVTLRGEYERLQRESETAGEDYVKARLALGKKIHEAQVAGSIDAIALDDGEGGYRVNLVAMTGWGPTLLNYRRSQSFPQGRVTIESVSIAE